MFRRHTSFTSEGETVSLHNATPTLSLETKVSFRFDFAALFVVMASSTACTSPLSNAVKLGV